MKESWMDTVIRCKALIAGKWLHEDKKLVYEFMPLFNLSVEAKLTVLTINTNKTNIYNYWLMPQPPVSPEREDGVPVDQPLLCIKFGFQAASEYEIKYISDSLLIFFAKGKPELEEMLTKIT